MYTLLLVDDEEEVIEAIVKKVKWEELGFQVTGHANNGFKAMDMLEEMQPDVVMTDIRMPYMDGLELCAHIKAKYPATKILLFTGFDDFEYAKEAVHLEIEEYILKPLNAVEITEVFKRLKEKLDYEISEKRNTDLLKKYYADSLPMLPDHTHIGKSGSGGHGYTAAFGIGRPAGRGEPRGKMEREAFSLSWGYHYDYAVKK